MGCGKSAPAGPDPEMENLQNQITQLNKDLSEEKNKTRKLTENNKQLNAELVRLRNEVKGEEKKVEEPERVASATPGNEDAEREIARLKKELKKKNEEIEMLKPYKNKVDERDKEIQRLVEENNELRRKLAETSAELEKLNEEMASKNQSGNNGDDAAILQERLTKKILENNRIIEENANLRSYLVKQKKLIENLKYTNKELKNDNKEKGVLVETLVRELTDLDIAMHKKDDHISDLTMKKSNLETINQALNNAKVMLEKECNELEDEIDELENTPMPVLLSHTVMLPPLASPAPAASICLVPRKISIKSIHSRRSRSRSRSKSRKGSRKTSKVAPSESVDETVTTNTINVLPAKRNGEEKEIEKCEESKVDVNQESKDDVSTNQESKMELRKTSISSSSSCSSSTNTHLTSESSTVDN